MNHQPFEDWLLEEKPLTVAEKCQLDAHLRACEACTAIVDVNLMLHSVKPTAPAISFAERFRVRLEAQKKAQRRWAFWGFFILVLGVAGLLAWLAWPVLALAVESPANLISTWISSLVSFWTTLQAWGEAGSVLLKIIPGFIPSYVWTLVAFILAGLSLLWVASLRKFTKLQQGV